MQSWRFVDAPCTFSTSRIDTAPADRRSAFFDEPVNHAPRYRPRRWSAAGRSGCACGVIQAALAGRCASRLSGNKRAVVGQYPLAGDPGLSEEGVGPLPEVGGGFLRFVGGDLPVGETEVVVDGSVRIVIAGAPAVLEPRCPAEDLCPPPSGTLPDFSMLTYAYSPGFSRS